MLLLNSEPRKCERCGEEYKRVVLQDMERFCVKCGKSVNYCDRCTALGCPDCGGRLVDIWTYWKEVKGGSIMF